MTSSSSGSTRGSLSACTASVLADLRSPWVAADARVMCGRPLGCKRKDEKSDGRFDCDHVSGLFGAAAWPLAQMGSAIQSQTGPRLREPMTRTDSLDRGFDRSSSHSACL